MTTVDQAGKIILKSISPLKRFEFANLSSCLYRISAVDIMSYQNIPPFDNSAMDGFAIRAKDVKGAAWQRPVILKVIEDVPAGYVAKSRVGRNQAIRIMTGAPLPKGADSVVIVEETGKGSRVKGSAFAKASADRQGTREEEFVQIFKAVKTGENVRYAGEDVRKGEIVIRMGSLLKPGHIGMLASLGIRKIKVFRKPKVAILATGDELTKIEERLKPGKIRNSNSYSLAAQVLEAGGLPIILGIAKDKRNELKVKIKKGLKADMLLVCGGISVGKYDFVKDVLRELGAKFKFWKVAMRPGKPLAFGMIGKVPVFGLPGNPVSGMVSFEVFVRPAISKMLGRTDDKECEVEAVLQEDIEKKKGLRYFLRATSGCEDGKYVTRITGPQGSNILKSMVLANSLIILPEDAERVRKGESVKIRFL